MWSTQANAPAWQKIAASLINQKGRTLDLYFNVYNDGVGGNTAMILDNVTLTICQPAATPSPPPSVTPWPTLTPTPLSSSTPFPTPSPVTSVTASPASSATPFPTPAGSATPTPSDCVNIIRNGGFEWDGDWAFGWDPLLPFYNGNAAFVHSGARSMAQGAVNQQPVTTPAYSSIRQDITLPLGAATANITFWYYPLSNAAADGLSRQELILLDPLAYDETVEVLWRVTENSAELAAGDPDRLVCSTADERLASTSTPAMPATAHGPACIWTMCRWSSVAATVTVVLPEVIATIAPIVQATVANLPPEQQTVVADSQRNRYLRFAGGDDRGRCVPCADRFQRQMAADEPRSERQPIFDGDH